MPFNFFQKFFRRKPPKDLLPAQPIETVTFEHWWLVNVGYITEEDIKVILKFLFISINETTRDR